MFPFLHHYYSPQKKSHFCCHWNRLPDAYCPPSQTQVQSQSGCRHRRSHSQSLLQLPGGILIVVLAVVDQWHKSSFISPFSRLVVVLSTGTLVSASCHVPSVQLIDMLSAGTSSSASHHASASHGIPLVLVPPPCLCLSLHHSRSTASAYFYASASHHVLLLWLVVMLLPTGTSASAGRMAITRPLLWWLIVMLLI